jgi:hypothetical protein
MIRAKKTQVEILQKENPILRQVSCIVPEAEINSEEIKKIIADLKIAMNSQSDAIAISAIQIAKPVILFLISNMGRFKIRLSLF